MKTPIRDLLTAMEPVAARRGMSLNVFCLWYVQLSPDEHLIYDLQDLNECLETVAAKYEMTVVEFNQMLRELYATPGKNQGKENYAN